MPTASGEQRACGVLRISGEEAVATAEQVVNGRQRMRRRTLVRCALLDGSGAVIDDILWCSRAPQLYRRKRG